MREKICTKKGPDFFIRPFFSDQSESVALSAIIRFFRRLALALPALLNVRLVLGAILLDVFLAPRFILLDVRLALLTQVFLTLAFGLYVRFTP